MIPNRRSVLFFLGGILFTASVGMFLSSTEIEIDSNKNLEEHKLDVYYPGSEELGPNEMRVVALGTGMPNARPKQAAACWLVELGNGDKLTSDIQKIVCHQRTILPIFTRNSYPNLCCV